MPTTIKPRERESDIQKTILEGLSALRIWHIRMNSGAMFGAHAGKNWAVRFGRKGCADIQALVYRYRYLPPTGDFVKLFQPIWIEVKRPGQKQTPDQLAFQAEVEAEGHRYICVSSWEQVVEELK